MDYCKNRVTSETIKLLLKLAYEVDLKDAIKKYFSGDTINETEGRAVAHVALRDFKYVEYFVEGENIMPEIHHFKKQIKKAFFGTFVFTINLDWYLENN